MAQKWHIKEDGMPAKCTATTRPCPLGIERHTTTRQDAIVLGEQLARDEAQLYEIGGGQPIQYAQQVSVDADGLHITGETVARALANKNLSASLITGLNQCPAQWAAQSFVIPNIITDEPDSAARRGSMFHKGMELFFALAPEDRTDDALDNIYKDVLTKGEFADMADHPEAVEWLKDAIGGYREMGERPRDVKVAMIKNDRGVDKPGLEVFVKGRVGDTKREILGFIDRVVEDPANEGSVIVEDWKTGASVKRWNPLLRNEAGLAEARQQIIYRNLLTDKGYSVSEARLVFPVARDIVNVDLTDKNLTDRVTRDVEEADRKLNSFEKQNTFEKTPSFRCSWCPLVKGCDKARLNKRSEKCMTAFNSQPDMSVLETGFTFN